MFSNATKRHFTRKLCTSNKIITKSFFQKVRHDTPNYRPYHFVPGVPCTSAFNPASRDPAIWSKQPVIKTEATVPKTEPGQAYSSAVPVLVRRQPVLEIAARIATTMPRNRSQMIGEILKTIIALAIYRRFEGYFNFLVTNKHSNTM